MPRPFQEGPYQLDSTIRLRIANALYLILAKSPKVSPVDAGHIPRILVPNERGMKITHMHTCNLIHMK